MFKNFRKINFINLLLSISLLINFQLYRNWSEENKSPYNQIVKKCVGKKSRWRKIVKNYSPLNARSTLIMCFDKEFEKLREERIAECIDNNGSEEKCSKIMDYSRFLERLIIETNKL